jgi:hypothetical protein
MEEVDRDFEWLAAHPEVEQQHAGEWILVEDERVIAHATDVGAVLKVAREHPDALLVQARGDEVLIL